MNSLVKIYRFNLGTSLNELRVFLIGISLRSFGWNLSVFSLKKSHTKGISDRRYLLVPWWASFVTNPPWSCCPKDDCTDVIKFSQSECIPLFIWIVCWLCYGSGTTDISNTLRRNLQTFRVQTHRFPGHHANKCKPVSSSGDFGLEPPLGIGRITIWKNVKLQHTYGSFLQFSSKRTKQPNDVLFIPIQCISREPHVPKK